MTGNFARVVILGGGTAGWLSASFLAARRPELDITLVEAPDIPTIGVGEGTWPTMRETLAAIGIGEGDFLRECDASFKQGSRFDGWLTGQEGDSYLHPFTPPPQGNMAELLAAWRETYPDVAFDAAMTPQHQLCERALAPRQRRMPDFSGAVNYAYHLDAGKFANQLMRHATTHLRVKHARAHIVGIQQSVQGDITALEAEDGEVFAGDFFIDCSGQAAWLIGQQLGVEWVDRSDVSFNDRALVVQVPVAPDSPIAAQTIGTAHEAGWLWDIGLPKRRGIGCVYSSQFLDEAGAQAILCSYVAKHVPGADLAGLDVRQLRFSTGHRKKFWHRNCLAIGLSAGFIEPLEASAIVLIELSVRALAENFPAASGVMEIHARRFNELFEYRWGRIVDFLKLHYVLSRRNEPYWKAHRDPTTIPARLAEQLELWRYQPPSNWDFPQVDEIFSAASQQYVLYGMEFGVPDIARNPADPQSVARLRDVREQARGMAAALPSNRTYLDNLAAMTADNQKVKATA